MRVYPIALATASPIVAVALASLGAASCGGVDVATTGTTSSTASGTGGSDASSTTSAGTGQGGGGGGIGMPSDTYPAAHPAPPQVETNGGSVLTAPQLVPIFFAGDDPAFVTQLTDFTDKIGATSYWSATTSEYGVGPAVSLGAVSLAESAPASIDDTAIQTWLAAKLEAAPPTLPAATTNMLYVLYYPAGTTISLGGGGGGAQLSCQAFGGYHSSLTLDAAHDNQSVAYAVVPRCSSFGPLSGIDAITDTASHELIEAATDPYPMTVAAYGQVDVPHIYWERVLGGGEVGDMCAQFAGVSTKFPGFPYTVQRSWSNAAAKKGSDPCVPMLPNEVYFNAAPVLDESVATTIFGQPVKVKGVNIAVGSSKTIDVDLFSDADTGAPFSVTAKDFTGLMGGTPHLELAFDQSSGKNGQTLHLTITVNSTGKNKTASFIVQSTLGSQQHAWIGIVGSP